MKYINYFLDKGLSLTLVNNEKIKIKGLSSLSSEYQKKIIEYAKIHKRDIVFDLHKETNKADKADHCRSCGGTEFWSLGEGEKLICARCHPPLLSARHTDR